MKKSTLESLYTIATVTAFFILTAWGNALAMFIVAAAALLVGVAIFGKSFARGGLLVAAISFVVAFVVALILRPH